MQRKKIVRLGVTCAILPAACLFLAGCNVEPPSQPPAPVWIMGENQDAGSIAEIQEFEQSLIALEERVNQIAQLASQGPTKDADVYQQPVHQQPVQQAAYQQEVQVQQFQEPVVSVGDLVGMKISATSDLAMSLQFSDDAKLSQEDIYVATRVIEKKPNGNLVLESSQKILLQGKVFSLTVRGIVRSSDLLPLGFGPQCRYTVDSEKVSDLKIVKQELPISQEKLSSQEE